MASPLPIREEEEEPTLSRQIWTPGSRRYRACSPTPSQTSVHTELLEKNKHLTVSRQLAATTKLGDDKQRVVMVTKVISELRSSLREVEQRAIGLETVVE